jgi:hypothetical protein
MTKWIVHAESYATPREERRHQWQAIYQLQDEVDALKAGDDMPTGARVDQGQVMDALRARCERLARQVGAWEGVMRARGFKPDNLQPGDLDEAQQ